VLEGRLRALAQKIITSHSPSMVIFSTTFSSDRAEDAFAPVEALLSGVWTTPACGQASPMACLPSTDIVSKQT
jgi:hypothetical protein